MCSLLFVEEPEVDPAAEQDGGGLRHPEHDPAQRLEEGRQPVLNNIPLFLCFSLPLYLSFSFLKYRPETCLNVFF